MGRQLAAVVDGLLEPLVEDRLTAADALDILSEEFTPGRSGTAVERNRQACNAATVLCCAVLCFWSNHVHWEQHATHSVTVCLHWCRLH